MSLWWKRWPERLAYELDELRNAGVAFALDEVAQRNGVMRLHLQYPVNGEVTELIATYPDLYPYFRMEVQAPSLQLQYHQNPFLKNLCLLGRSTLNWSAHKTLLTLLREQLPNVVTTAAEENAEVAGALEDHQAEPFGEYYPYDPTSIVLVEGAMHIDLAEQSGTIRIGMSTEENPLGKSFLRGALLEVRSNSGLVLARIDHRIRDLYSGPTITGRWVRVAQPVADVDAQKILLQAEKLDPGGLNNTPTSYGAGLLQTWGILLREEVKWRQGQKADRWVFVSRFQERRSFAPPGTKNAKNSQKQGR